MSAENRLGNDPGDPATDGHESAFGIAALDIPGFSPTPVIGQTQLIPVVKDEPQGITATDATLSDLEDSAYRLRRIVGKIYIQAFQVSQPPTNTPTDFIITAGFIILRVNDLGLPLDNNTDTYNPTSLDNTRDPWIWRRTWRVANNADNTNPSAPTSNYLAGAGGVLDGPHIDAKTARNVSDEERLFLVLNGIATDGLDDDVNTGAVITITDLRVLASMRKQSGNRNNASR